MTVLCLHCLSALALRALLGEVALTFRMECQPLADIQGSNQPASLMVRNGLERKFTAQTSSRKAFAYEFPF